MADVGPSTPSHGYTCKPSVWCPPATANQKLLLGGLNNDVLKMVFNYIIEADESEEELDWVEDNESVPANQITSLSLVNKRLRSFCVQKLLQHVAFKFTSMWELNRFLRNNFLVSEGTPLLDAFRYVTTSNSISTCRITLNSSRRRTLCRTLLPDVLCSMHNLKEFSIAHSRHLDLSGTGIRSTFRTSQLQLPSVTGLRILSPDNWDFLLDCFPNIEVLVLWDNMDCGELMEAAGRLKHLRHLEMLNGAWSTPKIERLHQHFPNIQSLTLKGALDQIHVTKLGPALGQFSQLQCLAITWIQQITEEHALASWNEANEGDVDRITRLQLGKGVMIDGQPQTNQMFEHCRSLRSLCLVQNVFTHYVEATRRPDGSPEVGTWQWTRCSPHNYHPRDYPKSLCFADEDEDEFYEV
ncbi:hypothetical protein BDV95DRAFT_52671 [Massariosphaeria phaeospora]|uniref:Uncharacterized protein n=1 Tax=Massariosphaeria phaeospora TaxID=100035 RepID=A0A7C8ME27_9PLEO|nr:hypothetical protein BDV95DRAFT_52671 [Massariosphaeria phaeospora]